MALAAGMFAVFSVGVVVAVISGLNVSRSGGDVLIAVQYASEGLEAARSIRNRDYGLLTSGGWGLAKSGGVWVLQGSSDSNGKFTRTLTVSEAQRNGGNIVESGGTVDSNTKKIVSEVRWVDKVTTLSVSQTVYLTNWKAPI